MRRTISHTEIRLALDCEAKWDFRYGGHLAGTALRVKQLAPPLSSGRAWGRGVAAFHLHADRLTALGEGKAAISASLNEDLEQQVEAGFGDEQAAAEENDRLQAMLEHYAGLDRAPLQLQRTEVALDVPIPSRTGSGRASPRYRFTGYVDGVHDDGGRVWLVEYKLRNRLSSFEQASLARQTRWYAWAWHQTTGLVPTGVITDERLNEIPGWPRILKNGRVSSAVDQLTTPARYFDACAERDQDPESAVLDALQRRRWGERHRVLLTPPELADAGTELVAAAATIGRLDSGQQQPLRHATPRTCGFCDFRQICPYPNDAGEVIDLLYDRRPPKREREDQ